MTELGNLGEAIDNKIDEVVGMGTEAFELLRRIIGAVRSLPPDSKFRDIVDGVRAMADDLEESVNEIPGNEGDSEASDE